MKRLFGILSVLALVACSSNNCPLENIVTCNYHFYDREGVAIKYGDTFTVTTLLPGTKTVYIYRKLGYTTVTVDRPDTAYTNAGYTETIATARRDTVLINKASNRSYVQVPMSYYNKADTLVFAYSSISRRDTIIVQHDSYPHVELPECGTHFYHNLRSIRATDAAIDHVEIVNPLVNNEKKENVKIYFNGVVE